MFSNKNDNNDTECKDDDSILYELLEYFVKKQDRELVVSLLFLVLIKIIRSAVGWQHDVNANNHWQFWKKFQTDTLLCINYSTQ